MEISRTLQASILRGQIKQLGNKNDSAYPAKINASKLGNTKTKIAEQDSILPCIFNQRHNESDGKQLTEIIDSKPVIFLSKMQSFNKSVDLQHKQSTAEIRESVNRIGTKTAVETPAKTQTALTVQILKEKIDQYLLSINSFQEHYKFPKGTK